MNGQIVREQTMLARQTDDETTAKTKAESTRTDAAARLFQTPKRDLEAQGRLLHASFLAQHTWEIRWRQLMEGRELRSQAPPFAHLEGKPVPPTIKPVPSHAR